LKYLSTSTGVEAEPGGEAYDEFRVGRATEGDRALTGFSCWLQGTHFTL